MKCFGQAVIGQAGVGKTSYCCEVSRLLRARGRPILRINLDPGNEDSGEQCEVDVRELISQEEVMETTGLGPNGALLYAMEYIEQNWDWIENKISTSSSNNGKPYLVMDFPGQMELFTCGDSVRNILRRLAKNGHRIVVVQLFDALHCTQPSRFLSGLLTALAAMIRLEMPQINLLSKVDTVREAPYNLEYFCQVLDLDRLVDLFDEDSFLKDYRKLSAGLSQVVTDYSLLSLSPLSLKEEKTLELAVALADKANGYYFGAEEQTITTMLECADSGANIDSIVDSLSEKYFL